MAFGAVMKSPASRATIPCPIMASPTILTNMPRLFPALRSPTSSVRFQNRPQRHARVILRQARACSSSQWQESYTGTKVQEASDRANKNTEPSREGTERSLRNAQDDMSTDSLETVRDRYEQMEDETERTGHKAKNKMTDMPQGQTEGGLHNAQNDTTTNSLESLRERYEQMEDDTERTGHRAENKTMDMTQGRASEAGNRTRDTVKDMADGAKNRLGEARDRTSDMAEGAKQRAGEANDWAKEKAARGRERSRDMAENVKETAKNKAGDALDVGRGVVEASAEKIEEMGNAAKDAVGGMAQKAKEALGNLAKNDASRSARRREDDNRSV